MVTPYLLFSGQCEEAFSHYRAVFGGGEMRMATYGDAPENPEFPLSAEQKRMIMHGSLQLTDTGGISGADSLVAVARGGDVQIHVHCRTVREAEEAYAKLAAGGEGISPVAPNPPPHDDGVSGCVRDRFGFTWILSAEQHEKLGNAGEGSKAL